MQKNDLYFKDDLIIRVLDVKEDRALMIDCIRRTMPQSKICCCFSERGNCSSCSIDFQFNVQSGSSAKLSTAFNNGR